MEHSIAPCYDSLESFFLSFDFIFSIFGNIVIDFFKNTAW